jgi:hypothetical protein
MVRNLILSFIMAFAFIPVENAIAGVDLVSHRALYGMSLIKASSRSGIIGARGAMAYQFQDTCNSWISETKVILKINYSEGIEVETAWNFSSLESKDGMNYRFNVHYSREGKTVEVLEGKAEHDLKSGTVMAKFSNPPGIKVMLPKGTMFPTRHLAEMLKAGENKQLIFSKVVFDGASLESPYQINALITKSKAKRSKTNSAQHVRMAFFPVKAKGEEPEFELDINYRPDGVAERIKQDFGSFSLDLKPNNIEILKKYDC